MPDRKDGILLEGCAVTADKTFILPAHAASLAVSLEAARPSSWQGEKFTRREKRCHVMLLVKKKKPKKTIEFAISELKSKQPKWS